MKTTASKSSSASSRSSVAGAAVTTQVVAAVDSLRRRYLASRLAIAVIGALAVGLVIWLTLGLGDYFGEWSLGVRRSMLSVAALLLFAGWVWRMAVGIRDGRMRAFTRTLESTFDGFGQRLRTVLDNASGRISGPAEMLSSLGHQTLGRWETLTPQRLIPRRRLMGSATAAAIAAALVLGVSMSGWQWRTALLRAAGFDRPYTEMLASPGDARVMEGTPLEVSLTLAGRTDRDVVLFYREAGTDVDWIESQLIAKPLAVEHSDTVDHAASDRETATNLVSAVDSPIWFNPVPSNAASGHAQVPSMSRSEPTASFALSLGRASRPLEYYFATSIGRTPKYRIDVQPMIEVSRYETLVESPGYTGLTPRTFASLDVVALRGSVVTVTMQTNHPLAAASVAMGDRRGNLETVPDAVTGEANRWEFKIPTNQSLHWEMTGRGLDGTPMKPIRGRLRVRNDEAPKISWQDPHDEVRVHTLAELPMHVRVSDDYGITRAALVFQLGSEDEYVLTEWLPGDQAGADQSGDMAIDSAAATNVDMPATTRVNLEQVLPLESFGLSERDYIAYYAYAIDNRGGSPQRIETDVRYIDIRPLRQFYSEVEREPSESGSGRVLVQLDEIIRRQRFLINRSRRLVRGGADLSSQLGAIDRMVKGQSELAGLTHFLADFFISRGNDDVEALNQAEAAMLQAADSLAIGNFELTLVQQEDAQRALAEARRTLEIAFIKNPTPAQQRAMAKLARQLQQKLRRERSQTTAELADSLKRIAVAQSQLGKQSANGDSPSRVSGEGRSLSDGEGSNDEEDSDEEVDIPIGETLFAEQVELLERLRGIEEQLAGDLERSPLLKQRLDDAIEQMDGLAATARREDLAGFVGSSGTLSELLDEAGVQLAGMTAAEPIEQIATLRDMAASLANLESKMASFDHGESSDLGSAETEVSEAKLASRLSLRAETAEEVLRTPVDIGDVEASEVQETLQRFVEEQELIERLGESKTAARQTLDQDPSDSAGTTEERNDDEFIAAARGRSMDYARAAKRLEELYQQMATPRLNMLRQLEQRAAKLAQQMGGGGKKTEEDPGEPTAAAELAELADDLKSQGLRELAEELTGGGAGDTDDAIDLNRDSVGRGGPALVVEELRRRIREMILLDIAADRDAPVPPQYRAAVDGYFRVLAGQTTTAATEESP